MEIDVPVTMEEVDYKVEQLNKAGQIANESSVIMDTLAKSLDAYLETAEDGHYDSAKLEDDKLNVYDITGDFLKEVKPQGASFVADFKASPDFVFTYLEDQAGKIARGQ